MYIKKKFKLNTSLMAYKYIFQGGLGGFGLELCDWLILRGARKLVLTSRKGVSTGYQAMKIKLWQSYGAEINICQNDMATKEDVRKLLITASTMGPVIAIFNLALVSNLLIQKGEYLFIFHDNILSNLSETLPKN